MPEWQLSNDLNERRTCENVWLTTDLISTSISFGSFGIVSDGPTDQPSVLIILILSRTLASTVPLAPAVQLPLP